VSLDQAKDGFRTAPGRRIAEITTAAYVPVLLLGAWQAASMSDPSVANIVSSPIDVVVTLVGGLADGSIFSDLAASLQRALFGWILTVALATPLAIAAARSTLIGRIFLPVIDLLRPISPIAWIPLAVLWLGIGFASKLLIVFIVTFFVIFMNVYDIAARLPTILINVCRTFTSSRMFLLLHVILPASLRGIILGAQYGLTTAWGGIIVAEMVGADKGVGFQMLAAANQFDPTRVISFMVLIGLVGLALNGLFTAICGRLLRAHGVTGASRG
jgi:ABC-type nitrate/sulfonate/bicarbonate transport system permease component